MCDIYAKKKTHEQFEKEVHALVGNEYKILGTYMDCATHIQMKHKYGHEYPVTPNDFLSGCRCPKCYKTLELQN